MTSARGTTRLSPAAMGHEQARTPAVQGAPAVQEQAEAPAVQGAPAVKGMQARAPAVHAGRGAPRVLYICGDSRCGSTLLQNLMALQPGVCVLGEVRRLYSLAQSGAECSCGQPVAECPFWQRIAAQTGLPLREIRTWPEQSDWRATAGFAVGRWLTRAGAVSVARLILRGEQAGARMCARVYEAAAAVTGQPVVVDSSKSSPLLAQLRGVPGVSLAPVLMLRDGRGIVWSKMKRTGISVDVAVNRWLFGARWMLATMASVPERERVTLRYEDLCVDPAGVLKKALAPVGVPVEQIDLTLLPAERHQLGGSPRFRGDAPKAIELDERWRKQMPAEALRVFERRAGALNRRFGYE